MELKDTVKLMISEDYKDRFRAEYHQLKTRIEGLSAFVKKCKEGRLSHTVKCRYEILELQLATMESYLLILEWRANIEGIAL